MTRALRLSERGSTPAIEPVTLSTPKTGMVGITIRAAALNFADLLMIEGKYQRMVPLPATLGLEGAGEVTGVGPGVADLDVGQRVAILPASGALADAGVFEAAACRPLPDGVSFEAAAAIQIAHGTAYLALGPRGRLSRGETLVVLGASGGVGLAAVELGHAMGARVIAVARGEERRRVAEETGADLAIEPDGDLKERLRAEGGVDVVFDAVGGAAFEAAFGAIRPEGRLLAIGFASGEVPEVKANHLLVKNAEVIGVDWGAYRDFAPDRLNESRDAVLRLCAEGRIAPRIGHRLPLDRALEGLELLRTRRATGKIVIEP